MLSEVSAVKEISEEEGVLSLMSSSGNVSVKSGVFVVVGVFWNDDIYLDMLVLWTVFQLLLTSA